MLGRAEQPSSQPRMPLSEVLRKQSCGGQGEAQAVKACVHMLAEESLQVSPK